MKSTGAIEIAPPTDLRSQAAYLRLGWILRATGGVLLIEAVALVLAVGAWAAAEAILGNVRGDLRLLGVFAREVLRYAGPSVAVSMALLGGVRTARRGIEAPVIHGLLVGLLVACANLALTGLLTRGPGVIAGGLATGALLGALGASTGRRLGGAGLLAIERARSALETVTTPFDALAVLADQLAGSDVDGIAAFTIRTEGPGGAEELELIAGWRRDRVAEPWPVGLVLHASEWSRLATSPTGQGPRLSLEFTAAVQVPVHDFDRRLRHVLLLTSNRVGWPRAATVKTFLAAAPYLAKALGRVRQHLDATRNAHADARRFLAAELHDTIDARLGHAFGRVGESPVAAHEIRRALDETRRLIWALAPDSTGPLPLSIRLARLTEYWSRERGLAVELEAPPDLADLDPTLELVVIRTAQEALALASDNSCLSIVVSVAQSVDEVALVVASLHDSAAGERGDERGFATDLLGRRINRYGGTFESSSAPDGERTVRVILPARRHRS